MNPILIIAKDNPNRRIEIREDKYTKFQLSSTDNGYQWITIPADRTKIKMIKQAISEFEMAYPDESGG